MQTFHNSAPGPELDACLWSLTEVLKRLLKGAHQGKTSLFVHLQYQQKRLSDSQVLLMCESVTILSVTAELHVHQQAEM